MTFDVTWNLADVSLLWISSRALGLAAWVASSLTVVVGLISAQPAMRARLALASRVAIHRTLAFATVTFAAAHVVALIPDPYAKLSWVDAFVPGLATRMTFPTALGTLAFLLLLAVTFAGALRVRLSSPVWRVLHTAAYAVWPLATAHYVLMGTDTMRTWSLSLLGGVSILMAVTLWWRVLTKALDWVRVRGRQPQPVLAEAVTQNHALTPLQLTIVRKWSNTRSASTIEFERPPGTSFEPGQFLTLRVPTGSGGSVARCYSLCSTPTDGHLAITVKKVPNGVASSWLVDDAQPGDSLLALPPSGRFTLIRNGRPLLMMAAGSGITPVYSMVVTALADTTRHVTLFYANTDADNVIFHEQLLQLTQQHPERFTYIPWLESEQGRPQDDDIIAVLQRELDVEIYICGPSGFMNAVRTCTADQGFAMDRVHHEQFSSMDTNPFTLFEDTDLDQADDPACLVEAQVGAEQVVVPWMADHSLAEALLRAGVDAPRSCMAGRCATCACTVLAGEVLTKNPVDDSGVVLSCQTRPVSSTVSVRF